MPRLLLDWLVERYPDAKRQTLKRMVESGRVSIGGRVARKLKQPVEEGEVVAVSDKPLRSDEERPPRQAKLRIVHEDEHVLVVNKPAGLLTSTVERERRPTLLKEVQQHVRSTQARARVGLIHRLDRDAAGLLIFSKSNLAYQSLKRQFFHHTVRREYTAVVHGTPTPPKGRIESRLVERADGTVHSTQEHATGQRAVTEYELVRRDGGFSLLSVRLETGRKHQIRVHLSERGTPIVGDAVYGPTPPKAERLMLAATALEIDHPATGERMRFETPMPQYMVLLRS